MSWRDRNNQEGYFSNRREEPLLRDGNTRGRGGGGRGRGRGRGAGEGGDGNWRWRGRGGWRQNQGDSFRESGNGDTRRGAYSLNNLSGDSRKRGAKSLSNLSTAPSHCEDRRHRKIRQYPIGRKQLEHMLNQQADVIVLELLSKQSGYEIFIQQDDVRSENLILLMAVVSRACTANSNKENMHELFNITCEQKFMDKLCAFTMTIKRQYPEKASDFFSDLHIFLESYANAMPSNAIDRITNLVDACISVLSILQSKELASQELKEKYEELQNFLTESKERWRHHKGQNKCKGFDMDNMEPPDDFTELPVVPVAYDLSIRQRPFLRRNIVEGKYQDDEHYLDVQFRLLREDFVRPLRNGINDFRDGNRKGRDVRIYRDVTVIGTDIKHRRMIHLIKLNLPKHLKVENSKRLLFGNLLCFTNNNFKTMILASVAERDKDMIKEGVIGVKFESDIADTDLSGRFMMVESRAYYMAYKHVLQALKDMSGKGVPMAPYIIHVDKNVKAPNYLKTDSSYDLRVIKEMNMMKVSEAHNMLFRRYSLYDLDDEGFGMPKALDISESRDSDERPELQQVQICQNIEFWPSQTELGLDDSQHRALHGALTRQLAIIQGPPGTGKTFIGLKITQILLHNSQIWKDARNPTPILVVCFTNHALDQFLEGMTTYTNSIVRVGSRSKNEAIARFQINHLSRSLQGFRGVPNAIHDRNRELYNKVSELEHTITYLRATASHCVNRQGILTLHSFLNEDIIPDHLRHQLIRGNQQMMRWLLLDMPAHEYDSPSGKVERPSMEGNNPPKVKEAPKEKGNNTNDIDEDCSEDFFQDAEELLQQEEEDRKLDDDDDDEEITDHAIEISYEKTFKTLDYEMNSLTARNDDMDEYFLYTILENQRKALAMGLGLPERPQEMAELESRNINIWRLDFPTRWTLYKFWLSKLYNKIMKKLVSLEAMYQRKSTALLEVKNQEYLYIMRHASIVGMTTTGAAQYSAVMQDLAPAIVIIEEAAEILESHVITSLTAKCQHLILIGDHQQLRPSATVFELATKYGLETSLFERMIKNGLSYESLEYQHRMRPSISKLLVPSIYPQLKDHTSVTTYPNIRGVVKNLFFISHEIHEREESDDNNSHENLHEAEFMIALCRHLMLQGYDPEEVTILTPYSGQFFLLKKLQRDHTVCSGVRICVVDNFQGEENKIILLSLVRSNVEGKVGFLRTENRICVALSRAKEGLYISGNMDLLCASSTLWQNIRKDLYSNGNLDSALPLKCENHPDELLKVTTGQDFFTKSPEGGCLRVCNKPLPRCGHNCPKLCHMDDLDHKSYKCRIPCPKVLCSLDHRCPKKCWEECEPCKVMVDKDLPCGHTHTIECHIAPEKYPCPTKVKKIIPDCQHEVVMPCHAQPNNYICPMDCDTRVDCGHKCRLKCHVKKDPDHKNYNCHQDCTRLNAGCTQNHPCQKKCYEECGACVMEVSKVLPCGHKAKTVACHIPPDEVDCQQKCKRTLSCGHACKKMCSAKCGNCPVKVKKVVPSCQHTILIECGKDATSDNCDGLCPKTLPCGHPCLEKCKETCTQKCPEKITSPTRCPRNHLIMIPCYQKNTVTAEDSWIHCDKPCGQILDCGHQCEGKCGQCFQGRVHESCKKACGRTLVCGHICKHPCSANCPPCQEKCEWRCSHSKCKKACGFPCIPCMEPCEWQCKHIKCQKLCGKKCTNKPCDKPCEKKLKCGHDCIGFCGDPCPPLCRICDTDQLTDFTLLGFEEDDDARFVLLEDCGHCIEVQGLEGWLEQDAPEIGMKTCPKCRKPIYNNRRYKHIILETYKMVKAVKQKYFTMKSRTKRKEIELMVSEPSLSIYFAPQVDQMRKKLNVGSKKPQKKTFYNESELQLYHFQGMVLKKASKILISCNRKDKDSLYFRYRQEETKESKRLKPMLEEVINRVMQNNHIIAPQMVDEVGCELQRLMILPAYWSLKEKMKSTVNTSLAEIVAKLEKIMDPTIKFDSETEKKVKELLKESEKHVGGLGITNSERVMIIKAMGLKQGHWYKCPNGHVYCITECGGANQTSTCPDCGASIGGENHSLTDGNAVATEMDGASYAAWSNQNNLANYDLGNI